MKNSARNQFKGTVTNITKGSVNTLVTIKLEGGIGVTSSIAHGSVENLGLEVGKEAYAVIKASDVIVGIDD